MDSRTFLQEVARRFACDEQRADAVTFVVFQELRDRLTRKEAADVAAQLPRELKRLWEEGDRTYRDVRRTDAAEFVGRVGMRIGIRSEAECRRAIRAVFRTLQDLLGSPAGTDGEAWDVFSQLPKGMKLLWLEAGGR